MERSYDAFVSFADSDRELALKLKALFKVAGLEAYVATQDLAEAGEPRWRREITTAIRSSAVFVPIYTRRSLDRRWVMYELGVADCAAKKVFATKTAAVTFGEIRDLPGVDEPFVYEIGTPAGLSNLLLNVAQQSGRDRKKLEGLVHNVVNTSQEAESVLRAARTRWIFVAGSRPSNSPTFQRLRSMKDAGATPEIVLEQISAELTTALLTGGFHASACPQVPHVGVASARAATTWRTHGGIDVERFRIRGMYPIDRTLRATIQEDSQKRLMQRLIEEYRQSYLCDVEAMIVLGGNEGTEEETIAALNLGVRVICVPQIGGTGERMAPRTSDYGREPLKPEHNVWKPECAEAIVRLLDKASL